MVNKSSTHIGDIFIAQMFSWLNNVALYWRWSFISDVWVIDFGFVSSSIKALREVDIFFFQTDTPKSFLITCTSFAQNVTHRYNHSYLHFFSAFADSCLLYFRDDRCSGSLILFCWIICYRIKRNFISWIVSTYNCWQFWE